MITCVVLIAAGSAGATPGDLDQTFGTNGWAITSVGRSYSLVSAAEVQPDGKIVVAGLRNDHVARTRDDTFAAWRHLPTGELDATFDGDGMARVPFAGPSSGAHAVALEPDGRVVLAGYVGKAMGVARLLPDGSLDQSFGGGDGRTRIPLPESSYAAVETVELLADGRILLGGATYQAGNRGSAVVAITPEGELDPEFGAGGLVLMDEGFGDLTLDDAGRMVAATQRSSRFIVSRFGLDGSPDPMFGGDGVRRYTSGFPTEVIVDEAGRIVLTISDVRPRCSLGSGAVVRLTPEGDWDTSFSENGIALRACIIASGLVIQGDGRIVVAGSLFAGGGSDEYYPILSRLDADGALDVAFGDGGSLIATPEESHWMHAVDVTLQQDGKIVLLADSPYAESYELARFLAT